MIAVQLPDGRKISVQTDDPQEAAKAGRRVLAREAILKSGMGGGRKDSAFGQGATSAASGATLGLTDVADGLANAGITGVKNLGLRAMGKEPTYGMGDAYAADRGLLKDRQADHPIATNVGGLLGALGTPGGGKMADFITNGPSMAAKAPEAVRGLLSGLEKVGRGIAVGAPLGAISGATGADPGQELQGAATGAKIGAATSVALPAAASVAGKVLAPMAKGVGTTIARSANKLSGGKVLDAQASAAKRLTTALKADGATPAEMKNLLNAWLKTGASSPSMMDLATKLPSGGANTMRLLMGAASKGKAAGEAGAYADKIAGNLQDNALNRTRALTPDTRPAGAVRESAVAARGARADAEYGAIRDVPVDAAPILPALEGNTGRAAISGAYKAADARRLAPQMEELDRLRTAAGPEEAPVASIGGTVIPNNPGLQAALKAAQGGTGEVPVSLGTLDRLKIALNEAGASATRGENPSVGGGAFERAKEIDEHLAALNPEYAAARDNYARSSAGIEALDHGATGTKAAPDAYAAGMEDFIKRAGPEAQGMAGIGHRQALTDAIGSPAEGSTGILNKIATSTNAGRNLATSFGDEEAQSYQDAIGNEVQRLQNARRIDPRSGSQTAPRLDALADVSIPTPSIKGLVMGLVNKVRSGATMTDEERHAAVSLGLASPSDPNFGALHPEDQPIIEALHRAGAYLTPATAERASQ